MICDNLPNEKKYDNGTLPTYYFTKDFYIKGKWYNKGEQYPTYQIEWTYDDLIYRLRENIIIKKMNPIAYKTEGEYKVLVYDPEEEKHHRRSGKIDYPHSINDKDKIIVFNYTNTEGSWGTMGMSHNNSFDGKWHTFKERYPKLKEQDNEGKKL